MPFSYKMKQTTSVCSAYVWIKEECQISLFSYCTSCVIKKIVPNKSTDVDRIRRVGRN